MNMEQWRFSLNSILKKKNFISSFRSWCKVGYIINSPFIPSTPWPTFYYFLSVFSFFDFLLFFERARLCVGRPAFLPSSFIQVLFVRLSLFFFFSFSCLFFSSLFVSPSLLFCFSFLLFSFPLSFRYSFLSFLFFSILLFFSFTDISTAQSNFLVFQGYFQTLK